MAAGDIKSDLTRCMYITSTGGITKGQLEQCNTDGTWVLATDGDLGPWAVATETCLTGETHRAAIWGPVEVELSGTDDVTVGQPIMASDDGADGTVNPADAYTTGEVCGIALTEQDTSGNTFTMFLGLGGM
jgi:hypothetical protein